jgi:hypothetical protein
MSATPGLRQPWHADDEQFRGDGNGYVGDVDLEPEKAHTLAATFDWHAADRAWEFRATPYYTHVTDYIDAALQCRRHGRMSGTQCRNPRQRPSCV